METGASVGEGDAIRALGHLFRVTEVYLWDDSGVGFSKAPVSTRCDSLDEVCTNFNSLGFGCSSVSSEMSEFTSIEDMELAQEMGAMGLPVSFGTSKEKRNVVTGHQRKRMKGKNLTFHKDPPVNSCSMRKQVNAASSQPSYESLSSSPSCTAIGNKSTKSHIDVEEEMTKVNVQYDGELVGQAATSVKETSEKSTLDKGNEEIPADNMPDEKIEGSIASKHIKIAVDPFSLNYEYFPGIALEDNKLDPKLEEGRNLESASNLNFITDSKIEYTDVDAANTCCLDAIESFQCTKRLDHGIDSSRFAGNWGDWMVVWDTFYLRNYFYNCITKESTWYPPPGLEHFLYTSKSEEMLVDAVKDESGLGITEDKELFRMQEMGSFAGKQKDGKLLIQSCHEVTSQLSHTAGNLISDVTLFSEKGGSNHLEEHLLESGYSDVNKLGEDFIVAPFHSSDSHNFDESLEDTQNQSRLEEARSSFSPDSMNSDADGIDESFHEPEDNISFLDNYEEPHTIPFSLQSTDSTTYSGLHLKEKFGSLMLPTDKTSPESGPDCYHDVLTVNHRKKVRRIRSCQKKSSENRDLTLPAEMQGFSSSIIKYWCQRYSLFSKFDDGIKMDEEGWFSVTPELIARHHASRCVNGTVIDCFTGVGGDAIQFAIENNHVIAIDIDPLKIDYAHHNATIYGVEDRIDFIQGDFLHLAAKLEGDVIFMSPPWGGPDYLKVQSYDIKTMLRPQNGDFLFKVARMIAPKIVMFLPRNVDLNQLAELSLLAYPPWELEVEKNFLNGKLKAVTAYFSDTSSKRQKCKIYN